MSNFTPHITFETDFEGDHITAKLSRLKRKDMTTVARYVDVDEEGNLAGGLDVEQMIEFAAEVLPRYVEEFKGLKDADGNAISIETVVDEAYFLPLVTELVSALFDASGMKAADEKNSEGQPDTLS